MSAAHPGFAAVSSEIGHEKDPHTGKPYGKNIGAEIGAAAARHASMKAKHANPRLFRVKGK